MADSDVIAREQEIDRAERRARRYGEAGFETTITQTEGDTRRRLMPWGVGYIEVLFRGEPDLDHVVTPPIFQVNMYADRARSLLWAEDLAERDFTRDQWRLLGEMLDENLAADRACNRFRRMAP